MTEKPEDTGVAFVHNSHAPDVFADACCGFFAHRGVVRMSFESARVNHITSPGPVERVVIGRLVMPTDSAREFAMNLLQFLDSQKGAPDDATIQ